MVREFKTFSTKTGKPYILLHVDCSGEHGQVNAFGQINGENPVAAIKAFVMDHPNHPIRLRGYFSMFWKDTQTRLYNFTWYQWEPLNTMERKAAFILRGAVTAMKGMDGMGRISLKLTRPGKDGQKDIVEDFDVYALDPGMFGAVKEGDTCEVKGYLQQIEDEFGSASGPALPMIKAFMKVEA